jgi:hypothetical protein
LVEVIRRFAETLEIRDLELRVAHALQLVRRMVNRIVVIAGAVTFGCGSPAHQHGATTGDAPVLPLGGDANPNQCPPPPNPAGSNAQIAAQYAPYYSAYDLGAPPGVPDPLGGSTILASDPNTLLIGGASETSGGAIYSVGVTRDACNHIIGFTGAAGTGPKPTPPVYATTPYVDANLIYSSAQLLLYSEWPKYTLGELAGSATTPSLETDLRTLGMPSADDDGPGGIGFVPPSLAAAGQLRLVTWPMGRWYEVTTAAGSGELAVSAITQTATLPNGPGGFAYVPAGSPGFTQQAVIVAEWNVGTVGVYDVDASGDPMVATRRDFFSQFLLPWGAYFEPATGDYLFLSWGTGNDEVYIVQGFVPPPPIQ